MATRDEREVAARFAARYGAPQAEVIRDVEMAVIGGTWGANGYTTRHQADLLARSLDLDDGMRLLDLGAGRGWPGLYLASSTGCEVVLVDVPIEGLVLAAQRATREHLDARAVAAVSSARHLPFGAASFDAIVHTDVLCCVRPKTAVLRACRTCLRPGGRTAFLTIHTAPGLGRKDRQRASRDGPFAVAAPREHRAMLASAGFVEIGETDLTDEFERVALAWIETSDQHHDRLAQVLGEQDLGERQADRRLQLRAIQDGLLRRSLFTATRPRRSQHAAHP